MYYHKVYSTVHKYFLHTVMRIYFIMVVNISNFIYKTINALTFSKIYTLL